MANTTRDGAEIVGAAAVTATQVGLQPSSLGAFLRYFLYLGTVGFGGPIALAGYMQRDLVERRRWITDRDYKEGLALAQLAPGHLRRNSRSIWDGYGHACSARRSWAWRSCFRRS